MDSVHSDAEQLVALWRDTFGQPPAIMADESLMRDLIEAERARRGGLDDEGRREWQAGAPA